MVDHDANVTGRANWPVRVVRREEEDAAEDPTTPEQRLAMMWELAQQAWALAGLPMPHCDRSGAPIVKRRRDEESQ